MHTLRNVILARIAEKKRCLVMASKKINNKNLAEFWNAKHSQIYPELKKLLNEKLIFYEIKKTTKY